MWTSLFENRFLKSAFLGLAVLFLSASEVLASSATKGAGHEVPDIGTLFWPTCNFILYLVLMTYVYRKFARPVLRDQRIELDAFVVRAQNEMATLISESSQIKERLAMIQEEKAQIVMDLEKEGRLLADSIISQANQKCTRMKDDSGKWYTGEVQRVESDARRELVKRIVSKVKADLKVKFSSSEDMQFIKSNLVTLPGKSGNNA